MRALILFVCAAMGWPMVGMADIRTYQDMSPTARIEKAPAPVETTPAVKATVQAAPVAGVPDAPASMAELNALIRKEITGERRLQGMGDGRMTLYLSLNDDATVLADRIAFLKTLPGVAAHMPFDIFLPTTQDYQKSAAFMVGLKLGDNQPFQEDDGNRRRSSYGLPMDASAVVYEPEVGKSTVYMLRTDLDRLQRDLEQEAKGPKN